jgi:hypothetical protein
MSRLGAHLNGNCMTTTVRCWSLLMERLTKCGGSVMIPMTQIFNCGRHDKLFIVDKHARKGFEVEEADECLRSQCWGREKGFMT